MADVRELVHRGVTDAPTVPVRMFCCFSQTRCVLMEVFFL